MDDAPPEVQMYMATQPTEDLLQRRCDGACELHALLRFLVRTLTPLENLDGPQSEATDQQQLPSWPMLAVDTNLVATLFCQAGAFRRPAQPEDEATVQCNVNYHPTAGQHNKALTLVQLAVRDYMAQRIEQQLYGSYGDNFGYNCTSGQGLDLWYQTEQAANAVLVSQSLLDGGSYLALPATMSVELRLVTEDMWGAGTESLIDLQCHSRGDKHTILQIRTPSTSVLERIGFIAPWANVHAKLVMFDSEWMCWQRFDNQDQHSPILQETDGHELTLAPESVGEEQGLRCAIWRGCGASAEMELERQLLIALERACAEVGMCVVQQ